MQRRAAKHRRCLTPRQVQRQFGFMPFDREQMKEKVATLAAQGVFIGTSLWRYPWLDQLYTPARYEYRGKVTVNRFERDCLTEYAEVFKTVGVDATYYSLPASSIAARMADRVPDDFRFGFKVTDAIMIKNYPNLPKHGVKTGRRNADFLNSEREPAARAA